MKGRGGGISAVVSRRVEVGGSRRSKRAGYCTESYGSHRAETIIAGISAQLRNYASATAVAGRSQLGGGLRLNLKTKTNELIFKSLRAPN